MLFRSPSSFHSKGDWETVVETVVEFDPSGKPEDLFKSFMAMHKDERMLPADVPRDAPVSTYIF